MMVYWSGERGRERHQMAQLQQRKVTKLDPRLKERRGQASGDDRKWRETTGLENLGY